jgi:hypothetical protein
MVIHRRKRKRKKGCNRLYNPDSGLASDCLIWLMVFGRGAVIIVELLAKLCRIESPLPRREGVRGWVKSQPVDFIVIFPSP